MAYAMHRGNGIAHGNGAALNSTRLSQATAGQIRSDEKRDEQFKADQLGEDSPWRDGACRQQL